MPVLIEKPTLTDFQTYVALLEKERGFAQQDILQKCLMLGEEVGELFKAVRKLTKIEVYEKSKIGTVEEELADIPIYVCSVANRLDIDLK